MKRTVRIAIVGCGVIGPVHAAAYAANPRVRLVCACDLCADRAKGLAAKHGIPRWTTSARDVFADPEVDAVSICTDHASHAHLACEALAAGKDVLCEKALARTPADLRKMLAAAEAHPDRIAAAVFQHRFEPLPRALRALVLGDDLGTLLTVSGIHHCFRDAGYFASAPWRGTKKGEGGSVLINQSIHFLDLVQWMAGGARALRSFSANLAHRDSMEAEDTVAASVAFRNGALGTFLCTNASHRSWDWSLSFHGTKGAVSVARDHVTQCSFRDPSVERVWASRLADAERESAVLLGKSYYGTGHQAQIDDFVRAVATRGRPGVSFADAAETMDLVFRAYRDARFNERGALS